MSIVYSPRDRLLVAESLYTDSTDISQWCSACNVKLNGNKTMTVGRSRTLLNGHHSLVVDSVQLVNDCLLIILVMEFDRNMTVETYLRYSISSDSR